MIDKEGYRANVAIVIINNDNKVLWAKRTNENAWQFPQGGIKSHENAEEAMFRELKEEVGIDEGSVEILGKTSDWLYYDVPKNWISKGNNLYKGQKQIWFLLKFLGNKNDIFLKNSIKPEFDNWSWVDYWIPNDEVISFKRDVYSKALKQLSVFIDEN